MNLEGPLCGAAPRHIRRDLAQTGAGKCDKAHRTPDARGDRRRAPVPPEVALVLPYMLRMRDVRPVIGMLEPHCVDRVCRLEGLRFQEWRPDRHFQFVGVLTPQETVHAHRIAPELIITLQHGVPVE